MTSYTGIDDLTVSLDGNVLSVTFNRPDSLNSLTEDMLTALADTLDRAADDPGVRVVRLAGAGRGFCSGAGISAEDRASAAKSTAVDGTLGAANRAVRASLAVASDLVLASEKSFFLLAFTRIGLMPDGGATALVAAAIGRIRAMRMALLAERIPAAEALEYGLVSGVYPDEELEAAAAGVIDTLVSGPAVALSRTKQAINAAALTELDAAIARESEGQQILLGSRDFVEGTTAFQQRRKPTFTDG
jgi:enoyl-CoA hydratase